MSKFKEEYQKAKARREKIEILKKLDEPTTASGIGGVITLVVALFGLGFALYVLATL